MSECNHSSFEMDVACGDGLCPLCMEKEIDELHAAVNVHINEYRSEKERGDALRAENERLREVALDVHKAREALPFWRVHTDDVAAWGHLVNRIDRLLEAANGGGDA